MRAQGATSLKISELLDVFLKRFDLEKHREKRAHQLSGGEQQRVALARALVINPTMLILDEPFSSLDLSSRMEFRHWLRESFADFPGEKILITHEPLEALQLAEKIMVLEEGKIVQQGSIEEIQARPRSNYAASFVGLNLLQGQFIQEDEQSRIQTKQGSLVVSVKGFVSNTPVLASIHPHSIVLSQEKIQGSVRNQLQAVIRSMDVQNDRVRIGLKSSPPLFAEITKAAMIQLNLKEGMSIWASIKATEIDVYPD